uniref:C2H2-type domain-containing protein n=1 Tax=viral metagenome TaxID=1070528 RepID=A0A6C0DW56_9ZZZZ
MFNLFLCYKNMSKPQYFCGYCNKHYVMKSAYNNHLLKCKFVSFSSKQHNYENENENENQNISIDSLKKNMSINNLFAIVLLLYNKYEKMESDYNELKKYVAIVKNKINITDYLNQHYSSCAGITSFLDSLIFNQETLDKIFKYDYVDGILNILIDTIADLNSQQIVIPIKCFSVKENVLYIFDCGAWTIMDDTSLRKFIKYFDKKLLIQFLIWKNDVEKVLDPDTFGEIYIQNMKKVIGANFEKKNPAFMIKSRLYKHLKVDLKNIVHYDFV